MGSGKESSAWERTAHGFRSVIAGWQGTDMQIL